MEWRRRKLRIKSALAGMSVFLGTGIGDFAMNASNDPKVSHEINNSVFVFSQWFRITPDRIWLGLVRANVLISR